MRYRLIDLLICPQCGGQFFVEIEKKHFIHRDYSHSCSYYCGYLQCEIKQPNLNKFPCLDCHNIEIESGVLICNNCKSQYKIENCIPILNDVKDKEVNSVVELWNVEWNNFIYQEKLYGFTAEEEYNDFFTHMKWKNEWLYGRSILEAGAGFCRISSQIAEKLADEIVCAEPTSILSQVFMKYKNINNIYFVQTPLEILPFKNNHFDFVFAKGVLYYVKSLENTLSQMDKKIKNNGMISFTVWKKKDNLFYRLIKIIRFFSLKINYKIIFYIAPLFSIFYPIVLKLSRIRYRKIDFKERSHIIFNMLTAPYLNMVTVEYLKSILFKKNYTDLTYSSVPIGITARKNKE